MADDATVSQPARTPPPTREERRAARARGARLSRLPWLYDYSRRGRRQSLLVALLQAVLVVAPVLLVLRVATGSWFPPGAGLWLIVATFAQQALFRRLNTRAGRV